LLVGGSCGLAVHAALTVAQEVEDPAAMVAVILPDGGRAYLSKIFNDTWMAAHGMLERTSDRLVGDVLRAKQAAGEIPPLVVVETRQQVKDAIALLHEHRVSQLPVVSHTDPSTVVGSIGERGLLKHAADNPGIMGTDIVEVMEPPFPAVSAGDPVGAAVDLLAGDRQALLVTEDGRPSGIVTRADLLEALVS
jgi:cystathionine beta-synthase